MTRGSLAVLALAAAVVLAGCLSPFGQDAQGGNGDAVPFTLRLTPNPEAVPLGSPITFTAEPTVEAGDLAFEWDLGDGKAMRGTGLTLLRHTYSAPGSYLVQVRATAADGATAEASHRVAVDQRIDVSGTLTTLPGVVEADPYESRGELGSNGAGALIDLTFTRSTSPVALPGDARVLVTLLGPDGAPLYTEEVAVPPAGAQVNASVPAAGLPGEHALRIEAKEGAIAFTGSLTLAYQRGTAAQ